MADGVDFARVKVVVCEASDPLRRNIQQLLRQLGFGDVVARARPAECLPIIERGPVDLLICDDHGGDEAGFDMVHGLRHHTIDNNPFVVSIGTMDKRVQGKGAVARAVNSGSDALVVKPFTASVFAEHILTVAKKRRPFVATADYIGPTRRQRPRNRREAEMEFTVPNPVKEMAGGASREAMVERIRTGTVLLDRRKLRVDLREIELRAGDLRGAVVKGVDSDAIRAALAKLRAATLDIQRRMAKDNVGHVVELCHWMLKVADRIDGETSRRDPRNLAALPKIIEGFRVALAGGAGAGRSLGQRDGAADARPASPSMFSA